MSHERLENAKKILFILLAIDILISGIIFFHATSTVGTLKNIELGIQQADQSFINSFESWDKFYNLIYLTWIGVGVGIIRWLKSCYEFAQESIGVTELKNEGWTILGWLPILNLFKPYQVLTELYKVGSVNYKKSDGWSKESSSGVLLVWWILWVATHIIATISGNQIVKEMTNAEATISEVISLTQAQVWFNGYSIVIAVLWFIVAGYVTQRLFNRAPIEDLPIEPDYVSPIHTNTASLTSNYPNRVLPKGQSSSLLKVSIDEDKIYADIAEELETGNTDKGLWTRLFAETDGDERRMKALYIKKRAERLIAAEKLHLEQEHVAREQPYKSSPLDEPQAQPLIQEEIQPIKQLTPQETAERDAIRDRLAESIRLNKIQNANSVNSSSTQQKYDPETIKLIKKYVSTIKAHSATYETYDRFLYLIGGNIEAKGFLFEQHHIVTYKGSKTRVNNFLDIISWFETNVLPDFKDL